MFLFGEYVSTEGEGFKDKFQYPSFLYLITFFISFYTVYFLNYFLVCPRTVKKKQIPQFIVAAILLFLIYSGVRYLLEELLLFNITDRHNYDDGSRKFIFYVVDNSYYAVQAILYSTSLYLLFEYLENNKKMHTLQLEHKKAELNLLKSQLEPHFLFNTLNTFYTELVNVQPKTAKDIHRLSQLLRYVTYEAHQDFMPLNRELQFVSDYIFFQKKRFEDNLSLNYEVEGIIGNQPIPSLVLIHFIENIFKHGVLNDKASPAVIKIQITTERFTLTTRNKISHSENYSKKGIGEVSLRRRLSAIYGSSFQLKLVQNENIFNTYLSIPLRQ